MTQNNRDLLRSVFDQDAERYDRARPGYPSALFDDLADLTAVGPGSRVLEIGPGTGQATLPLAERGCQVVAVELGADLAAIARRNLARFPKVEVVTAAFEDWPLPPAPFDLVLAATAFHWIDPSVRVGKVADALRPGGSLATVTTHHVAGGDESFFAQAQDALPDRTTGGTDRRARANDNGVGGSLAASSAELSPAARCSGLSDRSRLQSPTPIWRSPQPRVSAWGRSLDLGRSGPRAIA
jgi:SAM-dependent methyltransferase